MSRPEGSTRTYQGTANQSINMIAAQFGEAESNKKQAEIFKKHVDAAFESGIEQHGHWDLTPEDSEKVTRPHLDNLRREMRMVNPRVNIEELEARFDDHVTERARRLHSGETKKARSRLATLAGAVSGGISRMMGMK